MFIILRLVRHPLSTSTATVSSTSITGSTFNCSPNGKLTRSLLPSLPSQDDTDGLCLGPVGFSECSDTTLWYVREPSEPQLNRLQPPNYHHHKRRRRRPVPMTDLGFALEYVEPTLDGHCLLRHRLSSAATVTATSRRRWRRPNTAAAQPLLSVSESLGSCQTSPVDRVFSWNVNGQGVLHTKISQKSKSSSSSPQHCLWRINATATLLDTCKLSMNNHNDIDDAMSDGTTTTTTTKRMAHLSLIRHVPAFVAQEREEAAQIAKSKAAAAAAALKRVVVVEEQQETIVQPPEHVLRSNAADAAHRHASEPLQHAQVKSSSSMIVATATAVGGGGGTGTMKKKPLGSVVKATTATTTATTSPKTKLFTLKDTNPILFIGGQGFDTKSSTLSPTASSSLLPTASTSAASYKLRRLETHPYLASAKNNVWTDPQTGLEYPTDLCSYLGHDLKKAGRHTLTGVGYYTKTVLNIKVCVCSCTSFLSCASEFGSQYY